MSDTKKQHGGARKGAGRHKSEETKLIRCPVGSEPLVKALIESYKRDSNNIFILDGHELFMILTHLKRAKVAWAGCFAKSLCDDGPSTADISHFVGDELLTCLARKGIIKAQP